MEARIPPAWGNRPACRSLAEMLAWLDAQANRHRAILRLDRCKVDHCGANTNSHDASVVLSPEMILDHQKVFASDILYAHDWLDENPAPGIPPRPVTLESRADGSDAMTEEICAEYSKLKRAIVLASESSRDDGPSGDTARGFVRVVAVSGKKMTANKIVAAYSKGAVAKASSHHKDVLSGLAKSGWLTETGTGRGSEGYGPTDKARDWLKRSG